VQPPRLEVAEGGAADLAAEERVVLLGHQPAQHGEHGDAAVRHLSLAEALRLGHGERGRRAEAQRVPEAQRRNSARQRAHVVAAAAGAHNQRGGAAGGTASRHAGRKRGHAGSHGSHFC
jgi:hypothetical protein